MAVTAITGSVMSSKALLRPTSNARVMRFAMAALLCGKSSNK
jgi:hypothetical protein